MKKGALSLYSKMISFFMLLLGYTACGDPVDEYGTPSADYKVLGKVVSAEGEKEAVEGIRVVMINNVDESKAKGDTTYTNAAGSFEIKRKDYPGIDFKIKFQDVDGEANGEFEEKIEIIDFKNAQYEGETTKDMGTIEMEVKKAPEEE